MESYLYIAISAVSQKPSHFSRNIIYGSLIGGMDECQCRRFVLSCLCGKREKYLAEIKSLSVRLDRLVHVFFRKRNIFFLRCISANRLKEGCFQHNDHEITIIEGGASLSTLFVHSVV
jgi:hypothetical protein